MKSDTSRVSNYVIYNVLVACAVLLLGYVGLSLSVAPSTASPFWPPAGLSLAAVIVYGRSIYPSVFISNFLLKFYSFFDFSLVESLQTSITMALITSLGVCLQVVFAAYLINRFIGKDDALVEDSKIIVFFALVVPLSFVVSASVGSATLFFQGFISLGDIANTWITWWLGDCIGAMIITPIALAFIAKPNDTWRMRRKMVAYPLIVMLVVVAALFEYNKKQEIGRLAFIFDNQVNEFHALLSNELTQHLETNQILKAFFDSSENISNEEFKTFTDSFFKHKFSTQALEWVEYVPADQQMSAAPIDYSEGQFVIRYIQPQDEHKDMLGHDLSANPVARQALLTSIASKQMVMTQPLQLIPNTIEKKAFALYSPVYYQPNAANAIAQLKGFTGSVFRVDKQVKQILQAFSNFQLLVKISDKNTELYNNYVDINSPVLNLLSLYRSKQVKVANRTWQVSYQPSAEFYQKQMSNAVWWLFLGGFLVTGLTAIGLLMLSGRTLRTEELIRSRTKELAFSEERWQFALKGNRQGVWDWNVLTGDIFLSTIWKQMLGYDENEIKANVNEWQQRLHADDKEQTHLKLEQHFQKITEFYENECRMLCKNGHYKWVVCRGMVVSWTDDNKPARMVGTVTDISDQKQAKDALELSEGLFRAIFEESPLGVALVDTATGCIDKENACFRQITGKNSQQLQQGEWISHTNFSELEEELENMLRLNAGEIPGFSTVKSYQHPDGVSVWVNMMLTSLTGVSKSAPYHLCMIEDITEKRQTEDALRRSQKMEAVGQLTGGIAHDFNNILNIILGNTELMKKSIANDDKALKRLGIIIKSSERAAALTKQLLSFTRNKAEQLSIIDINTLITEMDTIISRSLTPDIEISYLLANDLWMTEIERGDFEDALLNLVINARDAMQGRGHLIVKTENSLLNREFLRLNPDIAPGEYVQIILTDDGTGINPDKLEHIFEPFFTTKAVGAGTGLGLSMVFGFCQRSNGFIKVYSELGVGTTFRIGLPRSQKKDINIEQLTNDTQAPERGSETILVVDDEQDLIDLIKYSLEESGYQVLTAYNGIQAIEQLQKHPEIDLLFSDVVMPGGLNGYEVAEQAHSLNNGLKILLTSGFAQKGITKKGLFPFANNVLHKPYKQHEVILKIQELLMNKR